MPKILPFKGVRYNTDKIKDRALVVAPPYDIIPEKLQDSLYAAHPNNIVRLILNKIEKSDTEHNNRYTRAKDLFAQWLKDGILVGDSEPAFYIYSQEYRYNDKVKTQVGFIGLMELDMAGDKVLPHENTLAAPKTDRLNLVRQVKANLSPIFVLYDDKAHKIIRTMERFSSKNKPVMDVIFEGVRNRVWKLDDPEIVSGVEKTMASKSLFIADGHHRYEVSRMYAKEIEKTGLPKELKESSKYLMVYFVESDDKMLTVLPAHRLAKDLGGLKIDEVKDRLGKYFHIEKVRNLKEMMPGLEKGGLHTFGMYAGAGTFYLLKLKSIKESDKAIKDKPKEWKRLDVSILHQFIFKNILGISDADDNIEFVKDPEETVKLIDEGECKIAFFLNPTSPSEVKKIAKLGECMPRKATYFFPKPLSGLVINKF